MRSEFYTLPEINFVGGETQQYAFSLFNRSGGAYNLPGATVSFAVIEAVNRCGLPFISKAIPIAQSDAGDYNRVLIELSPAETLNLSGKYVYQISIKDATGRSSIPNQGILYITENINKSFMA